MLARQKTLFLLALRTLNFAEERPGYLDPAGLQVDVAAKDYKDAARPGGEGLRRTTGKDHWEVGSGIGSGHRPVRGSVLGSGHPSDSIAVSPETAVLVRAARGGQIVQPSRKSTAPAVAGTRRDTHVHACAPQVCNETERRC